MKSLHDSLCCTGSRDSKRMIRRELKQEKSEKKVLITPRLCNDMLPFLLLRLFPRLASLLHYTKCICKVSYFFVCDLLQFYCIAFVSRCIIHTGGGKKSHFNDDAVNNRKFFVAVLSNLFGMQKKQIKKVNWKKNFANGH